MNDDKVDDYLMTAESAARYMGLQTSTIRRMTTAGELPVVRPTGKRCIRFRHSDLDALIRMRSQPMTAGTARRVLNGTEE